MDKRKNCFGCQYAAMDDNTCRHPSQKGNFGKKEISEYPTIYFRDEWLPKWCPISEPPKLKESQRKAIAALYSRCGFEIPKHLLPPTDLEHRGAGWVGKGG
jgi:hypothetical protein